MKNVFHQVAFMLLLTLFAGCRMPGFRERTEDAMKFRSSLCEETVAYFATNSGPLTLSETMELARSRTLKLTQEQLNEQLAKIQRTTAFAAFLPEVEVTFSRSATDVPIERSLGDMTIQLNDQYVNTTSITLTQPIFTPNTWLLFTEAKKALRAQDLIRSRAEELLDVQVASLFYQTAVSEEMLKTYMKQRDATRTLSEQIDALAQHGYALSAEKARAKARLSSDNYQLRKANDTLALARARLFEILCFWPIQQIKVDGESMKTVLSRDWILTDAKGDALRMSRDQVKSLSPEELLWQTLVNRKELWAGDQMIEIRKTEVLRALSDFLPTLYGSVSGNYTTESLQLPTQYWAGGLTAVLSVFNGFQTINSYREAKARRRAEYQTQEDRALALMVAAFEAWQNWQRTFEQRDVTAQVLEAAEADYQVSQARYHEDLTTLSEVLDKLALLESARVGAVSAEYACALAEIVLRDAMGVGLKETRTMEKDAAEAFRKKGLLNGTLKRQE